MTSTTPVVARGSVERLWPGSTIVCLGTGPSLTQDAVDFCRGKARVIAVKHAIDLASWADVLYVAGSDHSQWWQRRGAELAWFTGLRFTLDSKGAPYATVLRWTGFDGLELSPDGLRSGKNSGFQSIGVARHLGAKRIVLLGFDMKPDTKGRDHYFGAHWHGNRPPFGSFLPLFETLVEPLRAEGIEVLNCTPGSALTCFKQVPLASAFEECTDAAA